MEKKQEQCLQFYNWSITTNGINNLEKSNIKLSFYELAWKHFVSNYYLKEGFLEERNKVIKRWVKLRI